MSSLIEASNKEDVPASGVQTIPGCSPSANGLPRSRSCNGFADTMSGRLERPAKASTESSLQAAAATDAIAPADTAPDTTSSRTSDSETKSQEGLQEFISMLAGNETTKGTHDTITEATANIDHLLTMMKSRQVDHDNLHHISSEAYQANCGYNNPIFNFLFDGKALTDDDASFAGSVEVQESDGWAGRVIRQLFARHKPHFPDSKPTTLSPSDFRFSFSPSAVGLGLSSAPAAATSRGTMGSTSTSTSAASRRYARPLRHRSDVPGGEAMHQQHTVYATAYVDEDECDHNGYESDDATATAPAQHLRPPHPHGQSTRSPGMIPPSDIAKYPHLQHRKILPMPKPRWKRKGLQRHTPNQQQPEPPSDAATPSCSTRFNADTSEPSLAPYFWQFSPPARELQQQRYAAAQGADHEDWGMSRLSLGDELQQPDVFFQEVFTGDDSSYRDNPKKMKRSTGSDSGSSTGMASTEYDERKVSVRRKDRKWRNSSSSNSSTPATTAAATDNSIHFPETTFEFSIDARTRENLKRLPKLKDLPCSQPSLGLSSVLRQTLAPPPPPPPPPPFPPPQALPLTARPTTAPRPPHPLPADHPARPVRAEPAAAAKKKGKANDHPSETNISKTAADRPATAAPPPPAPGNVKRGKKGQRKKKAADDDAQNTNNQARTSDLSLIRSTDPDEWICVFCQYEIFCRGMEEARRKGGYYRRRRERRRRLREVEARRAGECISGATSDFEDDPPVIDDMNHAPAPPPPPPPPLPPLIPAAVIPASTAFSTMDHHRRGRGNRAA